MKPNTKCPTCKKTVDWNSSKHKPFCSYRCKLIDLGAWADGSYSIPDDNPVNIYSNQDVEDNDSI